MKQFHVFAGPEKAYDQVPREELWFCLRKYGVTEKQVRVVQDMYSDSGGVCSWCDKGMQGKGWLTPRIGV